jgi:hypothetical protein
MSTMRTSLDHRQRIVLTTTVLFLFVVRSGLAAGAAIAATDNDGDGITDADEVALGTAPRDNDSVVGGPSRRSEQSGADLKSRGGANDRQFDTSPGDVRSTISWGRYRCS